MSTWAVTGCNRGIGLELCRQLIQRGDRVIAICRHASGELASLGADVVDGIDVGRDDHMPALRSALGDTPLDVVLNNAGVLTRETLDDLDADRMRHEFEVNTLGPLRITAALLGNIRPGGKLGIVSSRVGSIADNSSGGMYGYRISKAAVNMAGVNLAHDLRAHDIAVVLLHPGLVATEMTGYQGIAPSEAASGLIARLDELSLQDTGTFWHANGERLPW
jgi:NAD(P)-dependent dehydrogenase (short-subunit alcohol dehydrogenase family)